MGEIVNSISFQQNTLCWVQVELNAGQSITIQRVVESPLPFVINYDNVQKPTTAVRIANHLNSLIDRNDLGSQHVRFLLSARLGLVRKVLVDHYLPQEMYDYIEKQYQLQQALSLSIWYLCAGFSREQPEEHPSTKNH